MKTIKEAATEAAANIVKNVPEEAHMVFPKSACFASAADGFTAGANFAQKWIPVDELPEVDETNVSCDVLLRVEIYGKKQKNVYRCCIEAFYAADVEDWFFMLPIDNKNLEITPIEWRYIEIPE